MEGRGVGGMEGGRSKGYKKEHDGWERGTSKSKEGEE